MPLALFSRFRAEQSGNVAVVFAAILVPVIAIVATALDYGRAAKVRSQLAHASEAAAQAVSGQLHLERDQLAKLVRLQLDANLPGQFKDLPFEMAIPSDKRSIEIALGTRVQTPLMGLVGIPDLAVSASGFSRRLLPDAGGTLEARSGPRSTDAPSQLRDLWQTLFGSASPDPQLLQEVGEAAAALAPRAKSASDAEIPQRRLIIDGDDMRRATTELEAQLRSLPQFGGEAQPVDIERLMRDLRRSR